MTHYEDIYEIAADQYGLITAAETRALGIVDAELSRFVKQGKLHRVGHGVYRINHYIPTRYDRYADAVELVGEGTVVYGESVLAMHGLALVNPRKVTVATAKRVRRILPSFVRVVKTADIGTIVCYENIPCQSIADAIRVCRGSVMDERLLDAVRDARKAGLVTVEEARALGKELNHE